MRSFGPSGSASGEQWATDCRPLGASRDACATAPGWQLTASGPCPQRAAARWLQCCPRTMSKSVYPMKSQCPAPATPLAAGPFRRTWPWLHTSSRWVWCGRDQWRLRCAMAAGTACQPSHALPGPAATPALTATPPRTPTPGTAAAPRADQPPDLPERRAGGRPGGDARHARRGARAEHAALQRPGPAAAGGADAAAGVLLGAGVPAGAVGVGVKWGRGPQVGRQRGGGVWTGLRGLQAWLGVAQGATQHGAWDPAAAAGDAPGLNASMLPKGKPGSACCQCAPGFCPARNARARCLPV